MLVIVDADALIRLADFKHEEHAICNTVFREIIDKKVECLYPITAICEAVTVLQKPLKKPESAHFLIERLKEGSLPTAYISKKILSKAIEIFDTFDIEVQRGDTLYDAIVAAIAIQHNTKVIFSFDRVFERVGLGFILAKDYF